MLASNELVVINRARIEGRKKNVYSSTSKKERERFSWRKRRISLRRSKTQSLEEEAEFVHGDWRRK